MRPTSTHARTALAGAAVLALVATGLLLEGRVPFCTCGSITVWSGDIFSSQNSQQFADPYSFSHIEHGVFFFWLLRVIWPTGGLGAHAVAATAFEGGWELLENTAMVVDRYRETTISLGYVGDSVFNSIGDITFSLLGFIVATQVSGRAAIAIVAALEVSLAIWIRDGVILNIIMLLYPIDTIRRWQAGT